MRHSLVASVLLALLSLSSVAFASDSTWLLCQGKATMGDGADTEKIPVVVSALEHRDPEDSGVRDLFVTLIYGDHVSRGTIRGNSEVTVKGLTLKLINTSGGGVVYDGGAQMSEDFNSFTLKGKIDLNWGDDKPTMGSFSAKLKCQPL